MGGCSIKAVMGLEVHVHLLTESKLFCRCSTDIEGKEPNSNTCPICIGFPGSKPMVNKKTIEHGIKISRALNCTVQPEIQFSRKNYFYPDMSKNFQITQYEVPLGKGGYLNLDNRKIRIRRVHLEEDPAKLEHVGGNITNAKYTLIDYNRSGIPLVEIVTEPDVTSPKEARLFLNKLSLILEHLGVYDPSGEGSIRIDANISLEGGQRVEMKNITGFRNVEDALNYEIIRQKSMTNMGLKIERETRHYDAETNTTSTLRKKEQEEDYGYIIEPDLVPIQVSKEWVKQLEAEMPELPDARIERFTREYEIPKFQSGILINTGLDLSNFYENILELYNQPILVANWTVNFLLKSLNYEGLTLRNSSVSPETFVELFELMDEGTISERLAKELIKEYVSTGKSPRQIVKDRNLAMMREDELVEAVESVIKENPKAVEDYRDGREKAVDYIIGQVLKKIKARASVQTVRKLVFNNLEKNDKRVKTYLN